jgi:predicted permease
LQAALSLVLLVGAGLFAQSLSKLQNTDLKLDATNRYIIHITPQAAGYLPSQLEPLYRAFHDRFHAIPGVVHVALATYTPMEDDNWGNGMKAEGRPDQTLGASWVRASAEYFDAVGTRVLLGRGFSESDTATSPTVAIVNKTFVKDFFPSGTNPIGKRIGYGGPKAPLEFQIVGVVDDTVYQAVQWKDHRMYFTPMLQRPPSDMESIARRTLAGINPNLAIVKFQTFNQQIADQFTEDRMIARLTILFAALALLLATIGLYGVTAYTVATQTSEIGIRMALGAERLGVIGMIMRGAMLQTGLGLAIGIPTVLLCARFVESQLYDVKGVNANLLLIAIGALALAASIAGWIPARRAASIDPAQALRSE